MNAWEVELVLNVKDKGEPSMELMSLKEYIELRPIEKNRLITNLRSCTLCNKLFHCKNMAYIMANKADGFGSSSFNICANCLPYWKQKFIRDKHPIFLSDDWHFSTWDLDKPAPHLEADRVLLYIFDEQFYLHTDYNPSRRIRNMIIESELH
jgi:hypothetical protein